MCIYVGFFLILLSLVGLVIVGHSVTTGIDYYDCKSYSYLLVDFFSQTCVTEGQIIQIPFYISRKVSLNY